MTLRCLLHLDVHKPPTVGFAITVVLGLLLVARPSQAQPIVYSFSGTGSGNVAGNGFTSAAFTIQVFADVASVTNPVPPLFTVQALVSTIDIAGIGSGTFTLPTRVFDNQNAPALGFSRGDGPDLLDLFEPPFANYDLRTSFGPVFEPTPIVQLAFSNIPSTLGPISFSSASNVTFMATLVPEPSSAFMVVMAAVTFAWRRRRKT